MYRTVITPTENDHTLELPKEFFGKEVEVTISQTRASSVKIIAEPPSGKKISLNQLFEDFGSRPDFPNIEEIRSNAWPSKW